MKQKVGPTVTEEEIAEQLEAIQSKTPVQKLYEINQEKRLEIEAELQKKLTKATPFLRGRICQILGLRMSPELRFYRDNTEELQNEEVQRAQQYMQ